MNELKLYFLSVLVVLFILLQQVKDTRAFDGSTPFEIWVVIIVLSIASPFGIAMSLALFTEKGWN